MKQLFCFLVFAIWVGSAHAGPMASIDYVHDYISAKTGVSVAKNAAANGTAPAYVKYLLAAIDKLNENSGGSAATSYQTHALATMSAIPTSNVWDATNRLFNCKAAGMYKTGSISITDGSGNVSCQPCTRNYYCPENSNDRSACNTGFTTDATGKTAATDCKRSCTTGDIGGSYAVSGTINQTQTPATSCALTSCAAQYYKSGNACTSCANSCSPTSQICTPTAVSPVASYVADSGTQTRSANCTNANGNTEISAICAVFGTCTGGTVESCDNGYTVSGNSCLYYISPTSCSSYTSNGSVDESTVSGCIGGSAGGAEVSSFVVGGYCSATNGDGAYDSPVIQTCADCSPATSADGRYCYCKIHVVKGTTVKLLSNFAYNYAFTSASGCASSCALNCGNRVKNYSEFRSALFSAIGS